MPAPAPRFLVTGATGFVGRPLVAMLLRRGHAVRAATRGPGHGLPAGVEAFEVGDLDGPVDWARAVDGVDAVVHLAARVHVMAPERGDPLSAYRRTNVDATLRLAEAAARAGVGRFVFASSIKALGEATRVDERWDDATPPRPVDPYGVSKLEAERALLALGAASPMSVTALRPPLMHGPGVKGNLLRLLHWIRSGWPLPFGAVENRRSLLAVDNFCDALVVAALHPGAAGRAFVLADAPDLSTPDLVRAFAAELGQPARLVPVPVAWLRAGARLLGRGAALDRLAGSLRIDGSGFSTATGWSAPVPVADALAATARAFAQGAAGGAR
ncbi:MAG: hypothetical protein RJA99_3420 [Pseudomonadota bacterium]|jgi:nucleoside-diphosphate-sugar epimerase